MKRIAKAVFSVILVLIIVLLAGIIAVWHNELLSLISFRKILPRNDSRLEGSVYSIQIKGNYYMDDFIKQGGISDDSQLIDFVAGHLTKGLIPVNVALPKIGCASFTAKTASGDFLLARNYDMIPTNTCLVRTDAAEGRHASISTADLSFLGMDTKKDVHGLLNRIISIGTVYAPLDGMNDAGVACCVLMSYQHGEKSVATNQNTEKPDFTTTTFLRMVLDYADNLDEAIEIAKAYDMHDSAGSSFHYMIAEPSGRSAILEWVAGTNRTDTKGAARELVITYNDQDSQIGDAEAACSSQWLTNFIIQPNYYAPNEEQHGRDRYEYIGQHLLDAGDILVDEQEALSLLRDVGRRTWLPSEIAVTVHSAVFNLTNKTVTWVPNEHFDDPSTWQTFRF